MRIWVVLVLVACKSSPAKETPPSTSCNSDSDCVVSCESKGNCCNAPCCESVQTAAAAGAASTYNAEHCKPEDHAKCPTVGGCVIPDYNVVAVCKAHACVAEKVPHIHVEMWNRACTSDADCTVVKSNPCPSCGCPDQPIAVSMQKQYVDAVARIQCPPSQGPEKVCSECQPPAVACTNGQCALK